MKTVLSFLSFIALILTPAWAFACRLAVREHAVFGSKPPQHSLQNQATVHLAIDQLQVPQRWANGEQTGWFPRWTTVRGEVIDTVGNLTPGQIVEIPGPFEAVCFYPDERYERDGKGRLLVWVSGSIQQRNGSILLLVDARVPVSSGDRAARKPEPLVWTKSRWPLPE